MSNVLQLDREKLLGRIAALEAENRLIMDRGSAAVIAELRAENQRLKKDQRRLEWLAGGGELYRFEDGKWEAYSDDAATEEVHENFRDAIDQAMRQEGEDGDE